MQYTYKTVVPGEPPSRLRRHEVRAQARELRNLDGQWALIRTYPVHQQRAAHNYASHITRGRFPAFRGCDAYATTIEDRVEVWARWDNTRTEAPTA